MPFGISPLELVLIVLIVLLVFGAKRLPEIGRNLGRGAREFKEGITGKDGERSEPLASRAEDADRTS
jgi:sec-independent protein translocase protein TatA